MRFTDCIDITGESCKTFDGNKNYISTGAVDVDHIVQSQIESVNYDSKPSRANLMTDDKSVLFAKMQGTKKVLFINEDLKENVYSTGFFSVAPKNNILNKECLYHLLGSKTFLNQKDKYCSGATQKAITLNGLNKIEINIPKLEEQNQIAKRLDVIKQILDSYDLTLKKYDDLIKARFVELFGDPKINDKCWNSGKVSDFYGVKGGKRIPKGMGYAKGITEHPYLRATDMKNETILDDDIHYIENEVYEHIKRYTVKGGDIYLTNVGVNLGMAGVIPDKYDGANLTENAVKLVPKTDKVIDGRFLAHYINSPGIQAYIDERKMSVGVPKLAIFRIETMPLLLPPLAIQMQFVQFCDQIDKSKFRDFVPHK